MSESENNGHVNTIKFRNMRSFDRSQLEMHDGIVVCLGNSNEGKSNIVRGIVDVLTNRTGCESFVMHNQKIGVVMIDDIVLSKGKSKTGTLNRYSIQDESVGDGFIHFESVGRGGDRKSTRLNSSHTDISRMPSSA